MLATSKKWGRNLNVGCMVTTKGRHGTAQPMMEGYVTGFDTEVYGVLIHNTITDLLRSRSINNVRRMTHDEALSYLNEEIQMINRKQGALACRYDAAQDLLEKQTALDQISSLGDRLRSLWAKVEAIMDEQTAQELSQPPNSSN